MLEVGITAAFSQIFSITLYTAGTLSGAIKMAMAYGLHCIVNSRVAQVERAVVEELIMFETGNSV